MRTLIKSISCAAAMLLLSAQLLPAFSILGPGIGGGTLGDAAWEVPVIGYGIGGDVATPKNIGEGYRRVTPVMYYASDSTFINFFGTVGLTNIDSAFAMMNGVMLGQTNTPLFLNSPTNGILSSFNNPYTGVPWTLGPASANSLDSYTTDLADFPLESQAINGTAQAALLTDLRSTTLALLCEQMGLGEPERYTWTLHDRFLPSGLTCPLGEEYLVVQRNFDVINSPFNQLQYSSYVNGTLYTYSIEEFCTGPNPLAVTVPLPVDQFADSFTAVASDVLEFGGYYYSLTRDDVGGLRYLMSSNNIVFEAPSTGPATGQLIITNTLPPTNLVTTLPLSLLLNQSLTNDPATLQTNFPGLSFLSVITNVVTLVSSNVNTYFTNLPPPYTNTVPFSNNMAVYPPNGNILFTNWTPVQYGNQQLLTTLPLESLIADAQFLNPAELEAEFPGLLVGNVQTNFFTVQISTNIDFIPTNQTVLPVFSPPVVGGLPIATHATNIYYFTNQPGPTVINYDRTQPFATISTLDLGAFVDQSYTDAPAVLEALYPGLEVLQATTSPSFVPVTNYISYLTNLTGAPYQGAPKLVTLPVSVTYEFVTNWHYTFGNVFTNHFSTNRIIKIQSIWITNQVFAPYGSPFIAVTNTKTITTNLISGDFFLIPTNWCGFDLVLSQPLGNPPYAYGPTNTIIYAGYNSSGSVGTNAAVGGTAFGLTQSFYDIYTNYNYAVYPGICEPTFALTTNYSTNIFTQYQYQFLNVVTNHYYTNSPIFSFFTNIFFIPGGSPNQLGTNIVNTSFYTNLPGGDFYIIPTNWCGFQIGALLTNLFVDTNIVLTNQTFGSGTVTSAQLTVIEYFGYTNYTYSIRPGQCEPTVGTSTNYSTNITSQYSYYFGNVVTNHYFTNGPITVVTTNDAAWTNGLVGMITNIITTNVFPASIGGDFYIIPPSDCGFTILSTQLTSIVVTTNTTVVTNVDFPPFANPLPGETYSTTVYTRFTNSTFLVQQATCSTVNAPPALRQGIGRVEFIRANYDSLLGQFFQPITNTYTMVMVTNSQMVTEYYQRVITTPDFLMRAEDLTTGGGNTRPIVGGAARNLNFDSSEVPAGLAGPGTIVPSTVFTFDKVGDVYANGEALFYGATTNAFLNQSDQGSAFNGGNDGLSVLTWASFDSSTNLPVVYPNGTSIANVVNQLYIQVSPSTVPAGTHNVAYTPVVFTVSGGQSPYTWAAPNFTVPGLNFNASTQTLSGTPTAAGVFTFTIQVTDGVNRTISLSYSITIN